MVGVSEPRASGTRDSLRSLPAKARAAVKPLGRAGGGWEEMLALPACFSMLKGHEPVSGNLPRNGRCRLRTRRRL